VHSTLEKACARIAFVTIEFINHIRRSNIEIKYGVHMVEFEDSQITRIAKKIAISDGVPEDAIQSTGLMNKRIEVDDKYASKFTAAIEKAKSLINDGDKQ